MTKKKQRAASPRPPDRGVGADADVGRQASKAAARLNAADGTTGVLGAQAPTHLVLTCPACRARVAVDINADPALDAARAEGLREAARMVDAKGDLLRKTRGGMNKACYELTLTAHDLTTLADKIVTGKATITDDHDDARQAMQVITMSAGNIRARVGREHSIGAKVADDVARIERNIERLDATIGRIEKRADRRPPLSDAAERNRRREAEAAQAEEERQRSRASPRPAHQEPEGRHLPLMQAAPRRRPHRLLIINHRGPMASKTKTTEPAPTTIRRGKTIVAAEGDVEMMDITPDFAAQLIARQHPFQRPLKEHYVFDLSRAMVEGRWRWTADVIRLDKDLRVIDGQHRLAAVVKSGITLKDALIATVRTKDAILSIDQNRPRTLNDMRATRGQPQLSRLITGAIIAESCDWYQWRGMPRELQLRTVEECKLTAALEALTMGPGQKTNRQATLTVGALSGALRCMRTNLVDATKFFDAVFSMTPIIDGREVQMARVLYTFLAESKSSSTSTEQRTIEHAHKSVSAYNHWKTGRVVTRLQWSGGMPPRVVG